MNELALQDETPTVPDFYRPPAIMDPARFQHLASVAKVMSDSSLMPETMRGRTKEESYANAFLAVNICDRWGTDPFLTIQGMSVVYGKLMVEGKIVAAVLDKQLGIKLDFDHVRDDKGVITGIRVSGPRRGTGQIVTIEGTIAAWATKDKGGAILKQWQLPQAATQLIYRGTREWARVYEPGILLGIITDDEIDPVYNARDITPRQDQSTSGGSVIDRLRAAKTGATGGTGFAPNNETTESGVASMPDKEELPISSAEGEVVSKASPSNIADTDAPTSSRVTSEGSSAGDSAEAGDATPPASSASDIARDHRKWLVDVAVFLWAATNFNGDADVLKNQRKASGDTFPMPDGTPKTIVDKASSVFRYCSQVVDGSMEPDDARKIIAGVIGVDEKTLGKAGA